MRLQIPPTGSDTRAALAWDRAVCILAALVAFVVYWLTLAPTLTGEDSGELIAAAYTLGVPHPSGYPLWTLLAKLAIEIVPAGTVAWRVNLMSSVFAAGTVWLLAETVLLLTQRRSAALVGGLAFAFSREFWEQSVIAEIYSLNALLVMLTVYLVLRWSQTRVWGQLYLAAFLAGLAAAHYSLSLLLLPIYAVYVIALDLRPRRVRRYLYLALLTLPGWLIYLYLPWRSMADPAMDWGNPETWHGFWDVVLRRQYGHLVTRDPRSVLRFVQQLWTFLGIFAWEFTPWVLLLSAVGLAAAWRERLDTALLLLGLFLLTVVGGILIPNFPIEHHWIWLNTPYWIPAYAIAAVFIGLGFARAVDWRPWQPSITVPLGLVVVVSPLVAHYAENDRSEDYLAYDYADNLLRTMAPDAVYFAGGDHTLFPVLYLQVVEGRRPDVLVANRYGYPSDDLYKLVGEPPPPRRPSPAEEARLFAKVQRETERPVYSAAPRNAEARRRVNAGLLYQYVPPVVPGADPWQAYEWREPGPTQPGSDWTRRLIAYEYHAALARRQFDNGRSAEALASLEDAASFIEGDKQALSNLGLIAAEAGELDRAARFFRRALLRDASFVPAVANLALYHLRQGDPGTALNLVNRGLEVEPDNERLLRTKEKALTAVEDR